MSIIDSLYKQAKTIWPDVFDDISILPIDSNIPMPENIIKTRQHLLEHAKYKCDSCTNCDLHKNRLRYSVFSDGTIGASIFVIGEGPGQYEQRTSIPFVSMPELKSSRCLLLCPNFAKCFPHEFLRQKRRLPDRGCDFPDKMYWIQNQERMARLGAGPGAWGVEPPAFHTVAKHLDTILGKELWRNCWNIPRKYQGKDPITSMLYITNVVKCRSLDVNKEDVKPKVSEAKICRKWLDIQLTLVQPIVVVTLGRAAGELIVDPKFKISEHSGEFYKIDPNKYGLPKNTKYLAHAYHPSAIERCDSDKDRQKMIDDTKNIFKQVLEVI